MTEMFNQSILEGSEGVGRLSITNQSSSTEATLDFESASQSTDVASAKTNKVKQDMRGSSAMGKKANLADVNLVDFDIQL